MEMGIMGGTLAGRGDDGVSGQLAPDCPANPEPQDISSDVDLEALAALLRDKTVLADLLNNAHSMLEKEPESALELLDAARAALALDGCGCPEVDLDEGLALLACDRPADAYELLAEGRLGYKAIPSSRSLEARRGVAFCTFHMARAQACQRHYRAALGLYNRARHMLAHCENEVSNVAWCHHHTGVLLIQLDDLPAALHRFDAAQSIFARLQQERDVAACQRLAGQVLGAQHHYSQAVYRYERARATYVRSLELQLAAQCDAEIGDTLTRSGRPGYVRTGMAYLYRAVRVFQGCQAWHSAAETAYAAAEALLTLKRPRLAIRCFRRALALFERENDLPKAHECHRNIGEVLFGLRQYEMAMPHLDRACTFFQLHGPKVSEARTRRDLAVSLAQLTRHRAALPQAERARELWHELEDEHQAADCARVASVCLIEMGRPQEAVPRLAEAKRQLEQLEQFGCAAECAYRLGTALAALGHLDSALHCYQTALPVLAEHMPQRVHECKFEFAMTLANRGQRGRALQLLAELRRQVEQTGDLKHIAACNQAAGVILLAGGDPRAALEHLRAAFQFYERTADLGSLPSCHQTMGRAYSELPDWPLALSHLHQAMEGWISLERENEAAEAAEIATRVAEHPSVSDRRRALYYRQQAGILHRRWQHRWGLAPPPLGTSTQLGALRACWRSADPGPERAYALGQVAKAAALADLFGGAQHLDLRRYLTADERGQLQTLRNQWVAQWTALQELATDDPDRTTLLAAMDGTEVVQDRIWRAAGARELSLCSLAGSFLDDTIRRLAAAGGRAHTPRTAGLLASFAVTSVSEALADDEALLELVKTPLGMVVFLVGPHGLLAPPRRFAHAGDIDWAGEQHATARGRLWGKLGRMARRTQPTGDLNQLLAAAVAAAKLVEDARLNLPWVAVRSEEAACAGAAQQPGRGDDLDAPLAALWECLAGRAWTSLLRRRGIRKLYLSMDAGLLQAPIAAAAYASGIGGADLVIAHLPQGALLPRLLARRSEAAGSGTRAPASANHDGNQATESMAGTSRADVLAFVANGNVFADSTSSADLESWQLWEPAVPLTEVAAIAGSRRLGQALPAGGVRTRVGKEALVDQVQCLASSSRLLVIAGHGHPDDQQPLRTNILLADGPLTASDMLRCVLPGTIVILHGCRTSFAAPGTAAPRQVARTDRSLSVAAPGLQGLVQACLLAGATAVIASTARVDDLHSALLLDRLCGTLAEAGDQPVALSLRSTQLHVSHMSWLAVLDTLAGWKQIVKSSGRVIEKEGGEDPLVKALESNEAKIRSFDHAALASAVPGMTASSAWIYYGPFDVTLSQSNVAPEKVSG